MMLVTAAYAPSANALNWTLSPDANALAFGVTVVEGLNQINFGQSQTQPQGIFGAGFTTTGTSFAMNFDADLYTWDSYNAATVAGTGYFDAFIVTISTQDFYWNLPHTDPIAASPSTFVWGGNNYFDGILEHYITAPSNGDYIYLTSAEVGS